MPKAWFVALASLSKSATPRRVKLNATADHIVVAPAGQVTVSSRSQIYRVDPGTSAVHVLAGDAAIPEILRRLRGWRWLVQAFRLPGMELLAPRLYAWVARHRYQISCMLGRPRG